MKEARSVAGEVGRDEERPVSLGCIEIRVYAELNDFLPPALRRVTFHWPLPIGATVKDLVEGLGIPHVEVDLVLVNGESVDWSYRPGPGDRLSVYPMFESLDIASLQRLRPRPLREPRFVADVHLGRLAAYLRLLGFDTRYERDASDDCLAAVAANERRILLTRDRGLLKRRAVTHGYWVRSTIPREQLREVVRRFDLLASIAPFERCPRCNARLEPLARETARSLVPPRSWQRATAFRRCSGCQSIYWDGTHCDRIEELIAWLRAELEPGMRE